MTDSNFQIDGTNIGNADAIEARVAEAPESDRGSFKLALGYLYLLDGPYSIPRERKGTAEKNLNEAELFVFQWLYKRTDGKLRRIYGAKVLDAVKKSRYQCAQCGFADVRALHIEKIELEEESETPEFVCLCANCNTIAAREKEMGVVATNRRRAIEAAAAAAQAANNEDS